MIHSLISAAAALVLLPAGTAFIATLIRPQLAPVSPPRTEAAMSEWWRSIPRTDLGVVPRDSHLILTAGAECAVLSGSATLPAASVPIHRKADALCAMRFSYITETPLECLMPAESSGAGCPTGALAILHDPDHTRILLPAGAQECCLIWRMAPQAAAESLHLTPPVPLATR